MLATLLKGASAPSGIQYVGGKIFSRNGTATSVVVSLTDLTGGLDTQPSTGDFVVIYFGTGSNTDRNLLITTGYTELVELYSNDDFDTNLAVFHKFMGATPDTSFTLDNGSGSADDALAVAVQVWRNVNSGTPFDVTRTLATGTNSVLCDPPAITPITNGAVIVSGGAGAHDRGIQTYSSSDLTDFLSGGNADLYDVTIGLGYHLWTSGSFNPAAFTFSNTSNISFSWAAVTLALRPA